MTRECAITGKRPMAGNNVSHANNRTRRRFLPNLQKASFHSETLGRSVSLRVSTSGIRTVEHKGGLDAFLLGTKSERLNSKLRRLKRQVREATAARSETAEKQG
ncbi:MAG: 50S ribosomal protein L28 [Alphaproteobacteria bacterium]